MKVIPVYGIMEDIQDQYQHVVFADMEFDNPEAHVIRNALETKGFMGIPFTMYYKNGKLVKATSSIQSLSQVTTILDKEFEFYIIFVYQAYNPLAFPIFDSEWILRSWLLLSDKVRRWRLSY